MSSSGSHQRHSPFAGGLQFESARAHHFSFSSDFCSDFHLWWHATGLITRLPSLIERTTVCFLHWPHDGEPDDAMQHDVVGGRQRLSEDFNQPC